GAAQSATRIVGGVSGAQAGPRKRSGSRDGFASRRRGTVLARADGSGGKRHRVGGQSADRGRPALARKRRTHVRDARRATARRNPARSHPPRLAAQYGARANAGLAGEERTALGTRAGALSAAIGGVAHLRDLWRPFRLSTGVGSGERKGKREEITADVRVDGAGHLRMRLHQP